MNHDRRSVLAAIGLTLPLGLIGRARAADVGSHPLLRFRSFEESVREAFGVLGPSHLDVPGEEFPMRRIEVGHSEGVAASLQGCHNDRVFAGFPIEHLRIIRTGSTPGPVFQGIRLYVATVDVALTRGAVEGKNCPLDFRTLPPAPVLTRGEPTQVSLGRANSLQDSFQNGNANRFD